MGQVTAIKVIATPFMTIFFTVISILIMDYKRSLKKVEKIFKPIWPMNRATNGCKLIKFGPYIRNTIILIVTFGILDIIKFA